MKLSKAERNYNQWCEKYYPITAVGLHEVLDRRKMSGAKKNILATRHSLIKWLGLRFKARKKHNIESADSPWHTFRKLAFIEPGYGPQHLRTFEYLSISDESCALCQEFLSEQGGCEACPLSKQRNGFACDSAAYEEIVNDALSKPLRYAETSPYLAWANGGDPEPMIRWLKRTLYSLETRKSWRARPRAVESVEESEAFKAWEVGIEAEVLASAKLFRELAESAEQS